MCESVPYSTDPLIAAFEAANATRALPAAQSTPRALSQWVADQEGGRVLRFAARSFSYDVSSTGDGTALWLHGRTTHGASVSARVLGVHPFAYVRLSRMRNEDVNGSVRSPDVASDAALLVHELELRLRIALATRMVASGGGYAAPETRAAFEHGSPLIVAYELVERIPIKGIGEGYGFNYDEGEPMVKMYFYAPSLVRMTRDLFYRAATKPDYDEGAWYQWHMDLFRADFEADAKGTYRTASSSMDPPPKRTITKTAADSARNAKLPLRKRAKRDESFGIGDGDGEDDEDDDEEDDEHDDGDIEAMEQRDDDDGERCTTTTTAATSLDEVLRNDGGESATTRKKKKQDGHQWLIASMSCFANYSHARGRKLFAGRAFGAPTQPAPLECYEADLDYVLRACIELGFKPDEVVEVVLDGDGNAEHTGKCMSFEARVQLLANAVPEESGADMTELVGQYVFDWDALLRQTTAPRAVCLYGSPLLLLAMARSFQQQNDVVAFEQWKMFAEEASEKRLSLSDIEVHAARAHVRRAPASVQDACIPVVCASFDCEMEIGEDGSFPRPEEQKVLQTCVAVAHADDLAKGLDEARLRVTEVAFTLLHTIALPSSSTTTGVVQKMSTPHVFCFVDERRSLRAQSLFFALLQPDIVTGFNICNFDFWYLLKRSDVLTGNARAMPIFGSLSRMMRAPHVFRQSTTPRIDRILNPKPMQLREAATSTRAHGTQQRRDAIIDGTTVFDVFLVMRRKSAAIKGKKCSLEAVSSEILGDNKEDVSYSLINTLQKTAEGRTRLLVYCLKDALLALRLYAKQRYFSEYAAMARTTGVPVAVQLARGQTILTKTLFYTASAEHRSALNPALFYAWYTMHDGERAEAARREKYTGASVLEPRRCFIDEVVATEDFASLYPSIMMTKNHDLARVLRPDRCRQLRPEDIACAANPTGWAYATPTFTGGKGLADPFVEVPSDARSGTATVFVNHNKGTGLIPCILDMLLKRRKENRDQSEAYAAAKQEFLALLYDMRQLALKTVANSIYGQTGTPHSFTSCFAIAEDVTFTGRMNLHLTWWTAESEFSKDSPYANEENKCQWELRVLYGDTDSVFIHFRGCTNVQEAWPTIVKIADRVTQVVRARFAANGCCPLANNRIKLEAEKAFLMLSLQCAKHYIGNKYTPGKGDKRGQLLFDKKNPCSAGIEIQRGDVCELVRRVAKGVIAILFDRDESLTLGARFERIRDYFVREAAQPLLSGTFNMRELINTKKLTRNVASYIGGASSSSSTQSAPVHVQVALKMRERYGDEDSRTPRPGDRVPYVITLGNDPSQKVGQRGEDPVYAFDNQLPIDTHRYLNDMLLPVLVRILTTAWEKWKAPKKRQRAGLWAHSSRACDEDTSSSSSSQPPLMDDRTLTKDIGNFLLGSVSWQTKAPSTLVASSSSSTSSSLKQCGGAHVYFQCIECGKPKTTDDDDGICSANYYACGACLADSTSVRRFFAELQAQVHVDRAKRADLFDTCQSCMGTSASPAPITCQNSACTIYWDRRTNERALFERETRLSAFAAEAAKQVRAEAPYGGADLSKRRRI